MAKEYIIDGKVVVGWYRTGQGSKPRPIFEDAGYHYGDLGKGRDTYYYAMSSSYRNTGHFGTGTYFFSKQQDKEDFIQKTFYGDRPEKKIKDINKKYNLFKPKDDTQAYILHEGLKAINNSEYDSYNIKAMKDMLVNRKINDYKITQALSKVYNEERRLEKLNYDNKLKADSLSTVFMKELGFEGIDVRHLEKYDTWDYGSVIYNLKK